LEKGDEVKETTGWRSVRVLLAIGVVLALGLPATAHAQLSWASKDGKSVFKVGLLGQLQAEALDAAGSGGAAKNLYLRRARILLNYDFGGNLSVFLETDSPNLGKAGADGTKNTGDIYIQDLVVSYKVRKELIVDGGMILPALSYNHAQSAATLMPVDYGAYTFSSGGALGARVGRDYGLQARGYALEDHLEYRLGVFQGARGAGATNDFRISGRVMYQLFTPQTGLFYRGTSLGKTRTLSFGASFDLQEDYSSFSGDVFFDQPLGGGNGLTLKAELATLDGDDFLAALPEQTNLLVEGGFYFAAAKLMPFAQYASQDFDSETRVDEERFSVGVGFFPRGHGHNVKLSWGQIRPDRGESRDQWLLQWQVFLF
jgi:hypothetical protein